MHRATIRALATDLASAYDRCAYTAQYLTSLALEVRGFRNQFADPVERLAGSAEALWRIDGAATTAAEQDYTFLAMRDFAETLGKIENLPLGYAERWYFDLFSNYLRLAFHPWMDEYEDLYLHHIETIGAHPVDEVTIDAHKHVRHRKPKQGDEPNIYVVARVMGPTSRFREWERLNTMGAKGISADKTFGDEKLERIRRATSARSKEAVSIHDPLVVDTGSTLYSSANDPDGISLPEPEQATEDHKFDHATETFAPSDTADFNSLGVFREVEAEARRSVSDQEEIEKRIKEESEEEREKREELADDEAADERIEDEDHEEKLKDAALAALEEDGPAHEKGGAKWIRDYWITGLKLNARAPAPIGMGPPPACRRDNEHYSADTYRPFGPVFQGRAHVNVYGYIRPPATRGEWDRRFLKIMEYRSVEEAAALRSHAASQDDQDRSASLARDRMRMDKLQRDAQDIESSLMQEKVLAGTRNNKRNLDIAAELGINEATVGTYKSLGLKKMQAVYFEHTWKRLGHDHDHPVGGEVYKRILGKWLAELKKKKKGRVILAQGVTLEMHVRATQANESPGKRKRREERNEPLVVPTEGVTLEEFILAEVGKEEIDG